MSVAMGHTTPQVEGSFTVLVKGNIEKEKRHSSVRTKA
tara:strand:- start:858 stop:971 length:114 start_codon:yes stop_codon:yes gene_type:complete